LAATIRHETAAPLRPRRTPSAAARLRISTRTDVKNRRLILAVCAGLAVSGAARAQYAIVTNQAGTFTDISGTGTLVGNGDDNVFSFASATGNGLFPAGTVFVSTNGVMALGASPSGAYTNAVIPASGVPTGLAAGATA